MTRGLSASLIIHGLTLGLILMFGNAVQKQVFEPPRTIAVKLVELPRTQPQQDPPPVVIEEVAPPKVEPEKSEELPPKEVPEEKPDPTPIKEPEKKPEPVKEEPKVELTADDPVETSDETPIETPVAPLVTGTSVEGTDSDFPFAYYLAIMEGQVARNWNPRQMGFRNDSGVSCVIHFSIQRNGAVTQITTVSSSGIGVYDREALRAIQSTRLPPLPADFATNSLGVTMTFNLESGE